MPKLKNGELNKPKSSQTSLKPLKTGENLLTLFYIFFIMTLTEFD